MLQVFNVEQQVLLLFFQRLRLVTHQAAPHTLTSLTHLADVLQRAVDIKHTDRLARNRIVDLQTLITCRVRYIRTAGLFAEPRLLVDRWLLPD